MSFGTGLLFAAMACAVLAACKPEPTAGTTAADEAAAAPTAGNSDAASSAGTAAQAVDDAVLTTRVKARLAAESGLDVAAIDVSSSSGRVTLSGTVPVEQIAHADAVVHNVEGVVEVVNALEPMMPAGVPPS